MEITQGNVSEAAKLLGIARTTLYSRMEAAQKHREAMQYLSSAAQQRGS
jgi:transcriptional regulator of acetoin/glycerol metabolism